MDRVQQLSHVIKKLPQRGPRGRRRYAPELREAILATISEERDAGRSVRETAERLGVPSTTVWRWLGRRRSSSQVAVALRPVHLAEPAEHAAPNGPVLFSPGGYRIEGASAAELALVLRALG